MTATTTVRIIITLPENTATVQRLYDDGMMLDLEEEHVEGVYSLIELVDGVRAQGGELVRTWDYISDDDGRQHTTVIYNLVLTH